MATSAFIDGESPLGFFGHLDHLVTPKCLSKLALPLGLSPPFQQELDLSRLYIYP